MPNVWKIAPGQRADHWMMCEEHHCILLGWRELDNYLDYEDEKAILKALGGGIGNGKGAARSIHSFGRIVEKGDIVVANRGRNEVVGIGIVESDYLHKRHKRNPSASEWLPHARLVKWILNQEAVLDPLFFSPPTVYKLSHVKFDAVLAAYRSAHPQDRELKKNLVLLSKHLLGDAEIMHQEENKLESEGAFDPLDDRDGRERTMASIVRRRGQPAFRNKLLFHYEGNCAFSDCNVGEVLEAAHIIAYNGESTNRVVNGLLLRSDLHTLFDLKYVTIDVESMTVLVSSKLDGTLYEKLRGRKVRLPKNKACHPDTTALANHRIESGI